MKMSSPVVRPEPFFRASAAQVERTGGRGDRGDGVQPGVGVAQPQRQQAGRRPR